MPAWQGISEVLSRILTIAELLPPVTDKMRVEEINNNDLHHIHGMCQPLKALGGLKVDAVVVAGIGMGALVKLQAQGIKVYRGAQGTVQQHIDLIQNNKLPQFSADNAYAGHSVGGCVH